MLDVLVGHLGDVYKTILMDTYIYKCSEVDYISDGSLKHHALGEILHFKNITTEDRLRHFISWVSCRLLKLVDYICKGDGTCAELFCQLFNIRYGLSDILYASRLKLFKAVACLLDKGSGNVVALRMY